MHLLVPWNPISPLGCSPFLNLFVFLRLDNFHHPIFKFADSFFRLLKSVFESSRVFFVSIIVLFSSRIFFSVSFKFVYLLLMLPFFFMHHFSFSTSFLNSLRVCKSYFKDCPEYLPFRSFPKTVSVDLLFSFEWISLFCFFVCLLIFLFNAVHLNLSSNMVPLEIRFSPFPSVCSFCYQLLCLCLVFFFNCCRLSLYRELVLAVNLRSSQVFFEPSLDMQSNFLIFSLYVAVF